MDPKDYLAKTLFERETSVDRLGKRILEEQLVAHDKVRKQIAESLSGVQSQAYLTAVKQLAQINWPKISGLMVPNVTDQLAETLTRLATSESFNIARRNAAGAVAATLEFQKRNRAIEAGIAASFSKLSGVESIASLSGAFAKQLVDLEQFHSQFAQTMAQTLKFRFDEFEKRNQEAFEQLEKSTDEKFQALDTKLTDRSRKTVLEVLAFLIALASLAIAIAGLLESNAQSKVNTALAVQMLTALQQIASKAEQRVNIYYVVERPVNVKEKTDNRSKTLATLERDDEVRLIERKHKWILVEYESQSGLEYGWVNKKYLQRVR